MSRFTFLSIALLAFGLTAFSQTTTLDPVGFCPATTIGDVTASACSTATGSGNETIGVGATSFGMFKTGGGTGLSPTTWYLLIAVPEATNGTATAPVITGNSGGFSVSAGVSAGFLTQTTPNGTDIYDIAGVAPGDTSMKASNMFCDGASIPCTSSNEITAFGSLPLDFEIFKYTITPAFDSGIPYLFTTTAMVNGTYLAAAGGSNPFSTPFTTTGLVDAPPTSVPEPTSILLLATMGLILGTVYRRRTRLS